MYGLETAQAELAEKLLGAEHIRCLGHGFICGHHTISFRPHGYSFDTGVISITISKVRKLRLREVKYMVKGSQLGRG